MPHRFITYNIIDLILGLLTVGLVGIFAFDPLIIAHMLATYTGAYFKLLYDLKIKKTENQWAIMYALSSVSFGYLMGNACVSYFKITDISIDMLAFALCAIASNYVAVASIKIFSYLESNSVSLTKDALKKSIRNFLGIK